MLSNPALLKVFIAAVKEFTASAAPIPDNLANIRASFVLFRVSAVPRPCLASSAAASAATAVARHDCCVVVVDLVVAVAVTLVFAVASDCCAAASAAAVVARHDCILIRKTRLDEDQGGAMG